MRCYQALLVVLVGIFNCAVAWASEPVKIVTVEGITEYQLDNGLRLLLFPDSSRPTVTINMTVLVGSRHEGYGEAGMAHLLEHMLFKGSAEYPDGWKILQDRGASANGTTWYDRTNYFETLPANDANLEFAIRFEADRLINCFVRREDLLSEMTVVRNEFEGRENAPPNLLNMRMRSVAYSWHNYGKDTIGNQSDIERVPVESLQDFYKRHYQPDNVVLIVAGKFDESKALNFVQQYLGAIPRPGRVLNTTYTEEPPQDGERRVELRRVGDVGMVQAMYHTPAGSHEDFAVLQILGDVLSASPSGRLYKALVETKKASSANVYTIGCHDPGLTEVWVEVRNGNSLDEARDIMTASLNEVISKGVTDEEVNLSKQRILNIRKRESMNTSSLAVGLSNWIGTGDWRLYFLHRDRLEMVTPEDVQRVAAKYFVTSNRTLGYFIPSSKADFVTIPTTPYIKSLVKGYKGRPPVDTVPDFDYSHENIEARTTRMILSSGIKAALLPKPTRGEKVEVVLSLRYGNVENLRGFREAASLLPQLMARGTKNLTYQQLSDEMTQLDVQLSAFGSPGSVQFRVSARRKSLLAALDLLRQILREPSLDANELEPLRIESLTALESNLSDPVSLSRNLLSRTETRYPAGDIRETVSLDNEISLIKAVTIEQVQQLYSEYVGAVSGELAIIGDFEPTTTVAKLNELLDNWKPAKPYAHIENQVFLEVPGGKQSILTPDKANANFSASISVAMNDQHPDYASLLLGNYILGGSIDSSRLANRIRQREGLSYGVSSFFFVRANDKWAMLSMTASCNPSNIERVETAVREELERLLRDGIPIGEFETAKEALLKSRKLEQNNDIRISSRLRRSLLVNQTLSYDTEIDSKLATLTPGEVQNALRMHFDLERLIVVTAGDFAKEPN